MGCYSRSGGTLPIEPTPTDPAMFEDYPEQVESS